MSNDVARGTFSDFSEFARPSQKPDYAGWLTKAEAAAAIGVTTKTIEKFAADRKIEQAAWKPQGRGAAKAVYNPEDVARIAQEREPGRPAFVLPAAVTPPVNGNGHRVPALYEKPDTGTPTGEEILRLVFAAALQTLTSENPPTSEKGSEKCFLTIAEAAAEVGLTEPCVRRLIKARGIATVRDAAGVHLRRRDLEAL